MPRCKEHRELDNQPLLPQLKEIPTGQLTMQRLVKMVPGRRIPNSGTTYLKQRVCDFGDRKAEWKEVEDELWFADLDAKEADQNYTRKYHRRHDTHFDVIKRLEIDYLGVRNERALWVQCWLDKEQEILEEDRENRKNEQTELEEKRKAIKAEQKRMSKAKPKDNQNLPEDINWVINNLYLIGEIDDPETWGIEPQDAPSARHWTMLLWAKRNEDKFMKEVMDEEMRIHRDGIKEERERRRYLRDRKRERGKRDRERAEAKRKREEENAAQVGEAIEVEDGMEDEWDQVINQTSQPSQ